MIVYSVGSCLILFSSLRRCLHIIYCIPTPVRCTVANGVYLERSTAGNANTIIIQLLYISLEWPSLLRAI